MDFTIKLLRQGKSEKIAGLVTVTSCVLSLSALLLRSADADQSEASPKNGAVLIGLEIECECQ